MSGQREVVHAERGICLLSRPVVSRKTKAENDPKRWTGNEARHHVLRVSPPFSAHAVSRGKRTNGGPTHVASCSRHKRGIARSRVTPAWRRKPGSSAPLCHERLSRREAGPREQRGEHNGFFALIKGRRYLRPKGTGGQEHAGRKASEIPVSGIRCSSVRP